MRWGDFELAAPDLARAGRARFMTTGVALLGTIRPDGTPRISPVEPYFIGAQLAVGVMPSLKRDDLARDARCVVHTSIDDSSGAQSEFKVYGRADRTDDRALIQAEHAWWSSRPRESFQLFTMDVTEAVLISWDPDFGRMRTERWRQGETVTVAERTYP